ncbi:MAG: tetratricopeptide repeat protein [Hyphomonadaceae bacterium]
MKLAALLTAIMLALTVHGAGAAWAQLTAEQDADFDRALDMMDADPAGARALIEPLANAGDGEALNFLSIIVANDGPGWKADPKRADELREAAIKAGSKAAALNVALGIMLDEDADHARGVELLRIADGEEQFHELTAYAWGRAYLFGWGVQRDMKKGVAYLEQYHREDNLMSDVQFLLGRAYRNGWDVAVDAGRAFTHMQKSAEMGDPRAQWNLGMMLLNGEGVDPDEEQAFFYVEQAAKQEYLQGMISYAVMLATAEGTEENDPEARKWYAAAARMGSAHAVRGLGGMLANGEGGPVDAAQGLALLELAAEAGDEIAPQMIALVSANIHPSRADVDKAKLAWRVQNVPLTTND